MNSEKEPVDPNLKKALAVYEPDVRKISFWYHRLWRAGRHAEVEDLLQAGRLAIWKIYKRDPEKLGYSTYVKAAIKYGLFDLIRQSIQKIKTVQLISEEPGNTHSLLDVLPVDTRDQDRVDEVDSLCHAISMNFSIEDADAFRRLVQNCDISKLNLSNPPPSRLKDRTRLVLRMDLSDPEMVQYANVLLSNDRFPHGYVIGHPDRAKKYIRFVVEHLGLTAQDFARQGPSKFQWLRTYGLEGFLVKVFNGELQQLFQSIFPTIPEYQVFHSRKWVGENGLMNAFNAIGYVRRAAGKVPAKLTREDFRKHKFGAMLKCLFGHTPQKAVEFRYPGTFPKHTAAMTSLRETMTANAPSLPYDMAATSSNGRTTPQPVTLQNSEVRDSVTCRICRCAFKTITITHVVYAHKITLLDYQELFPDAPLTSVRTRVIKARVQTQVSKDHGHHWTEKRVVDRIHTLRAQGKPLNARHLMATGDHNLYWQGRRLFDGKWDNALRAAGVLPEDIRLTRVWTTDRVLDTIREVCRTTRPAEVEDQDPALVWKARQLYGSWPIAVAAAGITQEPGKNGILRESSSTPETPAGIEEQVSESGVS